jgi:2-dehydro-3-deoxyphosphogluconate aldolase/(4S)-4-hydroxy-2-oxoglutarate aldolase
MTTIEVRDGDDGSVPGAEMLDAIGTSRVLPVLVIEEARQALPVARALKAGGLPCAEVTFRTPAAADAIRAIATDPEIAIGAGTVLTPEQVNLAADAGARYIVTPGFSAKVVRACQDRAIPVIPGVATATEIQMALDAGLELVKLFPVEAIGGLKTLEALSAPFPAMRFIPTGGINARNLKEYLTYPAVFAVGGSWMAPARLIRAGDFDEIARRARDAVADVEGQRAT